MKKSTLLKIILVFLAVIMIIVIITVWQVMLEQKTPSALPDKNYPSANQAGQLDDPALKKIKVELLSDEERTEMNLANKAVNPADIQVISRDENGKVTSYRKIYRPEDILETVYDPTGKRTAGMAIE